MPITDYDGQLQTIANNLGESPALTTTDGLLEAIAKGTENIITEDKLDDYLPLAGGTMTGDLEVNGNLTQGGKTVDLINASGSNYIRYENGLQICWGKTENLSSSDSEVNTDIALPVAFKDSDYCVSLITYWLSGGWNNHTIMISYKTTTSMKAYLRNINSTAYNFYFMWTAIGYWK